MATAVDHPLAATFRQEFDVEARNQHGEVVVVGRHIMYRLADEDSTG